MMNEKTQREHFIGCLLQGLAGNSAFFNEQYDDTDKLEPFQRTRKEKESEWKESLVFLSINIADRLIQELNKKSAEEPPEKPLERFPLDQEEIT